MRGNESRKREEDEGSEGGGGYKLWNKEGGRRVQ